MKGSTKRDLKLQGKTAIVTGSGRGIGKAIALAFAKEGANLVVVSKTLSQIQQTAEDIQGIGRRALVIRANVAEPTQVDAMITRALQQFQRIDILVNNAGVLGPIGPAVDNDIDAWIETVTVNLIGNFLCSKAVLPGMIQQGRGKIINLSGGGAAYGRPYFSAYAASKAAVVRFTECLAQEVQKFNIQVNAIAPGAVHTRMWDAVWAAGPAAGRKALAEAESLEKTGGTPVEKPAALAIFLASEESNGLTGRLISAVWDDWQDMTQHIPEIMASERYTLRRIAPR